MDDNTKAVCIAAFGALAGVVASVTSAIISYLNHRKLELVRKGTDGLTTALVKSSGQVARAEGVEEGKASGVSFEARMKVIEQWQAEQVKRQKPQRKDEE